MTEEDRLETIRELFRQHQGGRFDIEKILGIGGMGIVVRAQDTRLRVARAIKIFNPELNADKDLLRRFQNEAIIMAGIDHPNIVKVYDSGEIDGHHFIILEWIDGGSLGHFIERDPQKVPRAMHSRVALLMTYYICDALSVAHKRGVIHRDIKPDNILLTRDGVPKVADFGIAHMDDPDKKRLTGTNFGAGSPGYFAPEQVAELAFTDARTDVYAVAVTLWALMKGRSPQGHFFFLDIEDSPELMDDIPDVLSPIIRKAVKRYPADRHQSIEEFATALKEVEHELPSFDGTWSLSDTSGEPDSIETDPTTAAVTRFANKVPKSIVLPEPEPTLIPARAQPMVEARGTVAYRPDLMSMAQELPLPAPEPKPIFENVEIIQSEPVKPSWLKWVMIVSLAAVLGFVAVFIWYPRKSNIVPISPSVPVTLVVSDVSVTPTPDVSVSPEIQTVLEVTSIPEDVSQAADVQEEVTEQQSGKVAKSEQKKERKEIVKHPGEVKAEEPLLLKPKTEPPKPPPNIDPPQPKPEVVKVSVGFEGDKVRAWLVGQGGKFKLPGSVPPGVYKIVVIFPDQDSETTVLKNVEIKEGSAVRIHCVPETEKCSKL